MPLPLGTLDVDARSAALIDWRGGPKLATATGQAGVVTRETTGVGVDSVGRLFRVRVNAPRWCAVDLDGDGVRDRIGVLIEPARTNLVLASENFGTTWTASGNPQRTGGAHTASGVSLDLLGDISGSTRAAYTQTVTLTGDGEKAASIIVKKGNAVHSLVRVIDTTAGADRLRADLTWSGTTPALTMGAGTYLGADRLADGAWRLLLRTSSVTASHTHQVEVSPAAANASDVAATGTLYAGGVQLENAKTPSSYIKTTTTTATRAADWWRVAIGFQPQPLTIALDVAFPGTVSSIVDAEPSGDVHTLFALGDAGDGPSEESLTCYFVQSGTPSLTLWHHVNGTGPEVSVSLANMVAPLHVVATLDADGHISLAVTDAAGLTNGGEATSPSAALTGAFDGDVLHLGARADGLAPVLATIASCHIDREAVEYVPPPPPATRLASFSRVLPLSLDAHATVPLGTRSGIFNHRLPLSLDAHAFVGSAGELVTKLNVYAHGEIRFYTGPQPRSAADTPGGCNLLATFSLDNPAIDSGTHLLNLKGGFVYRSGTVDWFRLVSVDADHVHDGVVRTVATENAIVVNTLAWTEGDSITNVSIGAVE